MTFTQEIKEKIFPFLNSYQKDFAIHGNAHISRCLVYANALCKLEGIEDGTPLFYAIAFHDAGRTLDHGKDYNDEASVEKLRTYLTQENKMHLFDKSYPFIYKSGCSSLEHQIVFDTDVIDIMRESCGVGVYQFNKNILRLVKDRNYSDAFICECIKLIRMTDINPEYDSPNALDNMNTILNGLNFNLLCPVL